MAFLYEIQYENVVFFSSNFYKDGIYIAAYFYNFTILQLKNYLEI